MRWPAPPLLEAALSELEQALARAKIGFIGKSRRPVSWLRSGGTDDTHPPLELHLRCDA